MSGSHEWWEIAQYEVLGINSQNGIKRGITLKTKSVVPGVINVESNNNLHYKRLSVFHLSGIILSGILSVRKYVVRNLGVRNL